MQKQQQTNIKSKIDMYGVIRHSIFQGMFFFILLQDWYFISTLAKSKQMGFKDEMTFNTFNTFWSDTKKYIVIHFPQSIAVTSIAVMWSSS